MTVLPKPDAFRSSGWMPSEPVIFRHAWRRLRRRVMFPSFFLTGEIQADMCASIPLSSSDLAHSFFPIPSTTSASSFIFSSPGLPSSLAMASDSKASFIFSRRVVVKMWRSFWDMAATFLRFMRSRAWSTTLSEAFFPLSSPSLCFLFFLLVPPSSFSKLCFSLYSLIMSSSSSSRSRNMSSSFVLSTSPPLSYESSDSLPSFLRCSLTAASLASPVFPAVALLERPDVTVSFARLAFSCFLRAFSSFLLFLSALFSIFRLFFSLAFSSSSLSSSEDESASASGTELFFFAAPSFLGFLEAAAATISSVS
mmetsp:Transcript_1155/g.2587  ORF Transcript_1155/g.2587 Transcript_1155/m.2587 type:complete len:310 (-) Transcript_1155:315-1244(-)